LFTILAVTGLTVIITACSTAQENAGDDLTLTEKSAPLNSVSENACNFTAVLTIAEIDDLMHMREEEKVARDVYLTLYDMYKVPVFSNIARSEQAHMDAMLYLIDGYGLTDPVADKEQGEFTDAFQDLYDELILKGLTSLKDAYETGVAIEEMDISDLDECLSNTDVPNITRVYTNLKAASERHLKAFNTHL